MHCWNPGAGREIRQVVGHRAGLVARCGRGEEVSALLWSRMPFFEGVRLVGD